MLSLHADSAAFFLLVLPLLLIQLLCGFKKRVNLKVDALSACLFAFMLPLIADSAAFFLLMLPLIADSAALWLQKARQPKGWRAFRLLFCLYAASDCRFSCFFPPYAASNS